MVVTCHSQTTYVTLYRQICHALCDIVIHNQNILPYIVKYVTVTYKYRICDCHIGPAR
jgi:hypothetical protein